MNHLENSLNIRFSGGKSNFSLFSLQYDHLLSWIRVREALLHFDFPLRKPLNSRFYGEKSNLSSFSLQYTHVFPESGSRIIFLVWKCSQSMGVPWFGGTGLVPDAPQGWFKPRLRPKRFCLVVTSDSLKCSALQFPMEFRNFNPNFDSVSIPTFPISTHDQDTPIKVMLIVFRHRHLLQLLF